MKKGGEKNARYKLIQRETETETYAKSAQYPNGKKPGRVTADSRSSSGNDQRRVSDCSSLGPGLCRPPAQLRETSLPDYLYDSGHLLPPSLNI
jgi:hypothetical protein